MKSSARKQNLQWTCTWVASGVGGSADLVGGNDLLARVLEQFFVPPVRVLLRQPLSAQIVVAEPKQAQRLQEGLPVPSLGSEGCMDVGMHTRR